MNIAAELDVFQEIGPITDIAAGGSFCMALNGNRNIFMFIFHNIFMLCVLKLSVFYNNYC